jgi:hypothetical protein
MQQRTIDVRLKIQPGAGVADEGKVRLGGFAPSLPPIRQLPKDVADSGKVRLGGFSPAL